MTHRTTLVALALILIPALAEAQHSGGGAPRAVTPPREATQFDFLIGEWELSVMPKVSSLAAKIHGAPKFGGSWKAWRAFDGWGIADEMRILDRSGNPTSYVHALRFYDAAGKQWKQSVLDVYRARFADASATWNGTEMTVMSNGTDAEGRPTLARTRFYDIKPNGFRLVQSRSLDSGKTWDEGTLKIDARRIAAGVTR